MKDILKRTIIKILRKAGFELADNLALEKLISVFNDRMISSLNIITQKSVLSGRSSVTLFDLFGSKQNFNAIVDILPFNGMALEECNVEDADCENPKIADNFRLINIDDDEYPEEILVEEEKWVSPISTKVDRFIHIYEFMPPFPPIHTFRLTSLKNKLASNQSSKVKNRLEQSLRTEENMIKLIKSSGSIPDFVNFIHKSKR